MNNPWPNRLPAIFLALLIAAIAVRIKSFSLWGVTVTGAVFFLPLSNAALAVYTSRCGYEKARRLIWGSVTPLTVATLAVFLDGLITALSSNPHPQTALQHFDLRRDLFVVIVAFVAGQFVTAALTSSLKIYMKKRWPMQRILSSAWLGTSSIPFFIVLSTIDLQKDINGVLVSCAKVCLFFAVILLASTPLTYKLWSITRTENDVLDESVSLNPFTW